MTDVREPEPRADGQDAGEGRVRLEREFYTAKDAAQILGLSPHQVYQLLFRGVLPSLRRTEGVPDGSPRHPDFGGRYLISKYALQAFHRQQLDALKHPVDLLAAPSETALTRVLARALRQVFGLPDAAGEEADAAPPSGPVDAPRPSRPGDVRQEFFSLSETATILGVSPPTVRHLIERGELEAAPAEDGGPRRISRYAIDRLHLRAVGVTDDRRLDAAERLGIPTAPEVPDEDELVRRFVPALRRASVVVMECWTDALAGVPPEGWVSHEEQRRMEAERQRYWGRAKRLREGLGAGAPPPSA
jgi:excisionase family DNA binding protein